jgi:putative transposase
MVRDRLGVSERRACRYVGQHRSTQRREPVPAGDDEALRGELRAFAAARPRWGTGARTSTWPGRVGA